MIREDNSWLNKTITYTYDGRGNILTKTEYPYATGTPGSPTHVYNYQYGDSDQLINYDGNDLTYDGNGNLTSYNGSTYSWDGNNLTGIAKADDQITYQYNDKGIRTGKTVDNKYNVASQSDGTNTLTFTYDMYNCLSAMTFNGTAYTYEKDAQGDIIGLFDSGNNEVVKYFYDSWGKLISISGSLADTLGKVNPFRYRSYYYNSETQMYYLQSRYYNLNPAVGWFVAPVTGFAGTLLSQLIYITKTVENAGIIFVAHKWSCIGFFILFCILEFPAFVIFPIAYQAIKIDNEKISLCLWFITLRTFSWSEVSETGIAYTRAGYGTYKKFIYISKRPMTNKERFNILNVKDHKNFITMENRGHIIEDIKKCSQLPFHPLPNTEDFNNM